MILALGSDKGAPGATTLAAVLGLAWPSDRVVLELDPRGADLPFRLMQANGSPMATAPSIIGLAIDSRPGSSPAPLDRYAQQTAIGVPIIPGELSSRSNSRITAHLPAIASTTSRWPGTVIADIGELHASNPALVVARAAEAVLLVIRPSMEGLSHLRDRIEEVTELVADERRTGLPVGVVVACPVEEAKQGVELVGRLLASVGSPAPVLGCFAHDVAATRALWSGSMSKKLAKSALLRSGRDLVTQIHTAWPAFAAAPPSAQTQWAPEAVSAVPGGAMRLMGLGSS